MIGAALVIGLYLASVGEPVNQVVRMAEDRNCRCSGPANGYHDGSICDPHVFNQFCSDTSTALQFFSSNRQSSSCKVAGCVFKEIKSPAFVSYFQVSFNRNISKNIELTFIFVSLAGSQYIWFLLGHVFHNSLGRNGVGSDVCYLVLDI